MSKALKAYSLIVVVIFLVACEAERKPPSPKLVKNGEPPAAANGAPVRETGRSFIVGNEPEAQGYGLYSYLLFGSPPSEATRDRYIRAIAAYLEVIPRIEDLEVGIPRRDLNITYLSLKEPAPPEVSAEWALEKYNFPRARLLLRSLRGTHRDGPYIVSSLTPLTGVNTLEGKYLYQDLSSVPPSLVRLWVKEFLNQAAQERFWEERHRERWVLKLRQAIATLAIGLPEVRTSFEGWMASLDNWVVWVR